jgi:hypothetical protein
MSKPYVAPFQKSDTLILIPAVNGGWIVAKLPLNQPVNYTTIGAFGSANPMLAALSAALAEAEETQAELPL